MLIPDEKETDLRNLHQGFLDALQPVGPLECEFVDQIVATVWRLRRVRRVEAGIFVHMFRIEKEVSMFALGNAFITDAAESNAFSKLSRYETTLHRSLQRDLHELQRLQGARKGTEVQTPIAVDVTVDSALPIPENEP